jgi:hypothetical protein
VTAKRLQIEFQWIASLGDEVSPVEVDGAPAWMLAADVREARELAPDRSVRLLPGFDQYVVAASWHAEHLLPEFCEAAFTGRRDGFRLSCW